jgi:hypothetical protein
MAAPAVPILIGGLFAWSIYRRIRRNIGRQPLRPRRSIISLVILSLISLWIFTIAAHSPNLIFGYVGGLLPGGLLGLLGLRLTKFETTKEGHFYTPNIYIGVTLSVLFVGRMAYRMLSNPGMMSGQAQSAPFQSPLTLVILGLTVGYYLVYRIGVLVHNHDKNITVGTTPPPSAQP